jgi:hypothetical protein
MTIAMKYITLIILVLSFSSLAHANDSTAVRVGGRLEFKKTHDIAMLTEDLIISANKVRVIYTFRNESKQDIEEIIAFPIQEEVWEYDSLEVSERTQFVKNFIDGIAFKLISSEPVSPVEHELKIEHNVAYLSYHWKQKFPAGEIVTVSHEYQPAGGFITPKSMKEWGKDWKTIVDDYCIEPKLNEWIFQHGQSTNQVHYILKTGANWKAPIKHFKLTIKKETPAQKVSLCADNIQKIDDTTFQLEENNFLPDRDLRVLFINP